MAEANLIASDAIINYKTIQSLGYIDQLVLQYDKYYQAQYKRSLRKAHSIGFFYGFSQFVQNVAFAFLYYMGAEVQFHDSSVESTNIFIGIFVIFFAAWGMAQAN